MTNEEAWNCYMSNSCSPDNFIQAGLLFMVGASLQRRVWLGHPEFPVFPNSYIVLVGEPGIGKTAVIKPVLNILRSFKKHKGVEQPKDEAVDSNAIELSPEELDFQIKSNADTFKREFKNYLLPTAADATTYESLVQEHSRATSYIKVPPGLLTKTSSYFHCSIYVGLEEMATLFRKHVDDLVNYLLASFDCGDFRYSTKTKGHDIVKNCCLSLLAGTTPGFMYRAMGDSIINEGFSARTLFIYALQNRFDKFDVSRYTDEQLRAKAQVTEHIGKLIKIYAQMEFTEEALDYLKDYFEIVLPKKKLYLRSELKPYYARKAVHVRKLAICFHFLEASGLTTTKISLETVMKAFNFLEEVEKTMHLALMLQKRNPLYNVSIAILEFIKNKSKATRNDLLMHFYAEVNSNELDEVIRFLLNTNQLVYEKGIFYGKDKC